MFNDLPLLIVFVCVISLLLFIDLRMIGHKQKKMGLKESLVWSGIWIGTALIFMVLIYFFEDNGKLKAIDFISAYLIEKSLSVDNLFVFLMIFDVLSIAEEKQHYILSWGILSAIVLRLLFIFAGVALVNLFHPILYFFGIILFFAAYKMAFGNEKKIDLENNFLIKFISKKYKVLSDYEENKFFVKKNGQLFITTSLLALILIESADIVFAVDSIPAVFAITLDPFIVVTSNLFAILGLRALYFALAGIVVLFKYLKFGVAVILAYVGFKLIAIDFIHISNFVSLFIIISVLALSIIASIISKKKEESIISQ